MKPNTQPNLPCSITTWRQNSTLPRSSSFGAQSSRGENLISYSSVSYVHKIKLVVTVWFEVQLVTLHSLAHGRNPHLAGTLSRDTVFCCPWRHLQWGNSLFNPVLVKPREKAEQFWEPMSCVLKVPKTATPQPRLSITVFHKFSHCYRFTFIARDVSNSHRYNYTYVGPVAQSVWRMTTGWTVRGSNIGEARFSARPDRPWGPPCLKYNGYPSLSRG